MEAEYFLSGYCRQLDSSRTVTLVTEDGKLSEVDCRYPDCIYVPNCPIAKGMEEHIT